MKHVIVPLIGFLHYILSFVLLSLYGCYLMLWHFRCKGKIPDWLEDFMDWYPRWANKQCSWMFKNLR